MLGNFLKQSWLVMVAALVFGLLVAFVNGKLEGRIAENARLKLERAMQGLLTEAAEFDRSDSENSGGQEMVYFVGKDGQGQIVGYAIKATGGGFADKITLLVAVDENLGEIEGIAVLATNETPGFGDKMKDIWFKGQFIDAPAAEKLIITKTGDPAVIDDEIVAITGATITSEAVVKIVNQAVITMRQVIEK